jgi:hypothetical protein
MTNDKLSSYISSKLWNVSKDEILEILASYKEEEKPIIKHPIELVNEKYPNGWYCEAFDIAQRDLAELTQNEHYLNKDALYIGKGVSGKYSWCEYKRFDYRGLPRLNKSDYLYITKRAFILTRPQQEHQPRDYTGVSFKLKQDNECRLIVKNKYDNGYEICFVADKVEDSTIYSIEEIELRIKNGTWVELSSEQSIPVQLPPNTEQSHIIETLQDCVNDLISRVEHLEKSEKPNKVKKNLDIQGEEWTNNECLSWNDVKKSIQTTNKTDLVLDNLHSLVLQRM